MRSLQLRLRTLLVAVAILSAWAAWTRHRLQEEMNEIGRESRNLDERLNRKFSPPMRKLAAKYRFEASMNGSMETLMRESVSVNEQWIAQLRQRAKHDPDYRDTLRPGWGSGMVETPRREVEYYAKLKEKYEQAARFPWLPVEPDPPLPE